MMSNKHNPDGFIPLHGGYRNLIAYRKAEIVYDGTVFFCRRYFDKYDRTIDQMVQAARSGKQNIAEASMASGTSKEMEIKLTNVADPEICANVMIGLIKVTGFLLMRQINTLEEAFLREGGLRERMTKARTNLRKKP